MRVSLIITLPFLAAFPFIASAEVQFTEVMYDLESGSDTGREWIEIYNAGNSPVDVSGYRLHEGTTNHTLSVFQGNGTLPAGGTAIIADNPAKFLIDVPNFSGTILDSSFSLSNTGESLALKDSVLLDIDQLTYSSDMGANGDGKTLQRSGTSWVAALPTPGSFSLATNSSSGGSSGGSSSATSEASNSSSTSSGEESASSATASSSQTVAGSASGSSSKWPTKPQIYADAGSDKRVTVGTPTEFRGEALGIDKKPLENARYLWNFGDGGSAEGQHVLHEYRYPGSYIATLDVSAGEFSNSDKLMVTVVAADLALYSGADALGGYIEIENRGGEETDLSYWQLVSSGKIFTLPKDTFLLAKKSVRFSESVTRLTASPVAELHYPNGTLALLSSHSSSAVSVQSAVAAPVVPVNRSTVVSASPQISQTPVVQEETSSVVAAVAAAPLSLKASSTLFSHFGEYKWFYLLGVLLGSTLVVLFWLGRPSGSGIEIIEDPY